MAEASATMIELKDIIVKFGDFEALHNINVDVKQGEFFTFLGPSGCGKTTILSLIMGMNRPSSGEVCFPQGPCAMGYMLQRDNLLE